MAVFLRLVLLAFLAAVLFASPSHAEKRVALVIGNDAYETLPVLKKAVNDARAVAAALREIGFTVIIGENLTRRQMSAKLSDLDAAISPGDQVFFFFAGHGLALGTANYLIPKDMPMPRPGDTNMVRDEAFAVDALVARIRSRGAAVSFIVLDACRDNPFKAAGVRSIGTTRGLARVDAPKGVFVLFSAGTGQTALDRLSETDTDPNSVFTRKLVPLLKRPGLTHVRLAKQVQREVDALARTVSHEQQPAYYDQIIGEIILRPGTAADTPPVQDPVRPGSDPALKAWQAVKGTTSTAVMQTFVDSYPASIYAQFARARLRELRQVARRETPPAAPPTRVSPARVSPARVPPVSRSPTGRWLVILGSFPKTQRASADDRARWVARRSGLKVRVIDTDQWSNLRNGLYAVVVGGHDRARAGNILNRMKRLVRDAYIKRGY